MGQSHEDSDNKIVKYTLVVKNKGTDDSAAWEEKVKFYPSWELDGWTAEQDGKYLVESFNGTLRSNEQEREFVAVKDIEEVDEPTELYDFSDEEE